MSRRRKKGSSGTAAPANPPVMTTAATAASPARVRGQGAGSRRWRLLAGLAVALTVVGLAWLARQSDPPPAGPAASTTASTADMASPGAAAPVAFVDNRQCLECHADQAQQWRGSNHARAMEPASAQSVRGRFDGAEFRHQGVTSRFFQRDGKFMVRTDGPDGKLADFEVAWTFGVAPLQQYLIAQPGGRLQALQVAWDDVRKRWFHLLPHEKSVPGDVLHWTGRYQNGNTMCITCHTTGFEKRYDAATDSFDSRWKESNVSCQACHGPGQRHVEWARLKASTDTTPPVPPGTHYGLNLALSKATASQQVQVCASCHSRRIELTAMPVAGVPLLDQHQTMSLTEGLYHADGQQLDEVFVYGSFRQSKMYQKGVACSDCHNPHTGKLKLPGNATCLQCHGPAPNSRFPTAAGRYDSPAHHFHAADSAGAQCVACHMPPKTYMQIQPRADHSMRVPRPDLSVSLGVPNACTSCHADKPAQWAADRVAQWYGEKRRREPHYGEVFAAARRGQAVDPALAALAADPKMPAIVRATSLGAMRQGGAPAAVAATRDPDDAVRVAAAENLQGAPAEQRIAALGPLLRDPVRAVRIAAARSLSSLPADRFDPATRAALARAIDEFIEVQKLSLDMPGARLNLATMLASTGQTGPAEEHYLAALRIDPDFTPARANLAQLYNGLGRNADAIAVLQEGLRREPRIGELQYSLGLALAEENRLPEAVTALGKAAELLPGRARVHLNHGLALQRLGRGPQAVRALTRSAELDPADPTPAQALAVHYLQARQPQPALEWTRRWVQRAPGDAEARGLLARLEAGGVR